MQALSGQPGVGPFAAIRFIQEIGDMERFATAEVCANCGEEYVDEATTTTLLAAAEEAMRTGVQVDVRKYIAA